MTGSQRLGLGVVIANWNGREHLLGCLASLAKCEPAADHIIMVDNASGDGSVEAVAGAYPDVKVIINDDNAGFARANNQGAAEALLLGCDLVLFLNNDTLVQKDALGAMVRAAEAPGVSIVNPLITDLDGGVWFSGARVRTWLGEVRHEHNQLAPSAGLVDIDSATGCALLTTAAVVRELGPFDEDYFIYYEDSDLSARLRARGARIVLEPAARIEHLVSADSLSNAPSGFFYYLNTRNRLLFTRRHVALPVLLAFLAGYTLVYVAPLLLALLATGRAAKARALGRGYVDFFRGRFGPPRLA